MYAGRMLSSNVVLDIFTEEVTDEPKDNGFLDMSHGKVGGDSGPKKSARQRWWRF